jgi:predicted GH43/DUF377 family glycosyl hydrolase
LDEADPLQNDIAVRVGPRLNADPRRVITRLFVPGEETSEGRSRARAVIDRLLALDEGEVTTSALAVVAAFGDRHRDLARTLSANFDFVAREIEHPERLSRDRRTLLGACFTHEYSAEGAALCNPSMVAHPDQSNLDIGQLRFVMTVRCIGEGHISSIGFRTGVVGPGGGVHVDGPTPFLTTTGSQPTTYQKRLFLAKLGDLGDHRDDGRLLLDRLPDTFGSAELDEALGLIDTHSRDRARVRRATSHVRQIASCGYGLEFPAETDLAERLLWPVAPTERNGMEDARLVLFDDDGEVRYHATYTAYDGSAIDTRLLSTTDFRRFQVSAIAGKPTLNKGLALFPRRIRGHFYAVSRWDRESLSLARSADGQTWDHLAPLYPPHQGWDLIQVGNGGSPIETERGWLVITHGVGPMRSYALGAILLDLDDPSLVLASLRRPLLTPNADERDGYVPNVVYTCGALLHDDLLTIPYGISDGAIGFAQVALPELLGQMEGPES